MRTSRYLESVKGQLPEELRPAFERALAGDAIAARRLGVSAPKRLLGHIALLSFQRRTPNPAYREILKSAWRPEARNLLTRFWRPQTLRRMLARAEFPHPRAIGSVTMFRPVESSVRKAAAELCWSLNRRAAEMEALKANPNNPRIVVAMAAPAELLIIGGDAAKTVATSSSPRQVAVARVGGGTKSRVIAADARRARRL